MDREKLIKLEKENKKLRETLEYYASPDNWIDCEHIGVHNRKNISSSSIVDGKGGVLARQCLEEIDNERRIKKLENKGNKE